MKKITIKNRIILKENIFFFKKKKILNIFLNLLAFKLNYLLWNRLKSFYNFKLSKFPKTSHLNRFKKNCILSNRTRGLYTLFSLSRIKIKELSWGGFLTGVKRLSW